MHELSSLALLEVQVQVPHAGAMMPVANDLELHPIQDCEDEIAAASMQAQPEAACRAEEGRTGNAQLCQPHRVDELHSFLWNCQHSNTDVELLSKIGSGQLIAAT